MLASEFIKQLQNEINKYGDMPILLRNIEDDEQFENVTVCADPPSEIEIDEGITGTIDINYGWN
jgi:hypothetical protein